ncbi:hypothetical protein BASA81_003093 [Batrachochytrium salamandrivorans]|nr:hypothetical protein BASA81_003093 [Batrachochytrium salamandrivorans]
MGETFGHVVPGIFYSLIAVILLGLTRANRGAYARFDFSPQAKMYLGWGMLITCVFGISIEGIGGVLHNGQFLFQIAHESMYFGFAMAGLGCLLEASGRLPQSTWRFGFAMGFFVEGLVFYGHALEQQGVEQMLHMIMVLFSWMTSGCFLLGCWLAAAADGQSKALFVCHAMGLAMMLAKGLWFFIIADILYSGKFGVEGVDFMISDEYVYAGLLIVCLFGGVGGCLFLKPSGSYVEGEDNEDEQSLAEKAIPIS